MGANAPGIISPIGKCRIGFQPLPTFSPGHIGIVAKSGTLSYETVASITRSGLGQSLCIGMGGDVVAGTSLVDALKVFETDPDTEGIVLVGEVGGRAEEEAAEWIRDYRKRVKQPKYVSDILSVIIERHENLTFGRPIAALVGGRTAPVGRIMGHAGAWAAPGENLAEDKYKIIQDAGATMVDHPEKFGGVMKTLLSQAGKDVGKIVSHAQSVNQSRSMHTMRRVRPSTQRTYHPAQAADQRRSLHIQGQQAVDLLKPALRDISISNDPPQATDSYYLSITVDRSARQPCILVSPTTDPSTTHKRMRRIPYDYQRGPTQDDIASAIRHLQIDAAPPLAHAQTASLITTLASFYKTHEAITLTTDLTITSSGSLHLSTPRLHFDDAAYKSTKRQASIHALRDTGLEEAVEVEAERHGIVFVKLHAGDASASIGTLVNGAGLAMNTVDALSLPPHEGKCANFLDTGGKATSETVKKSFELILRDERVKVIFVNIFGGLTDCGMIAEGVIMAFNEVDMRGIPVVVRLRGTNEEVGQRKIAESGLELEAFDGFQEAATRVVELANAKR